jgi:hypothetical protein
MENFVFALWKDNVGEEEWRKFKPTQDKINAQLEKIVARHDYGQAVRSIFVAPELFSKDHQPPKGYRVRKFEKSIKSASYRLPIDREVFFNEDEKGRIRLITQNIIDSIRDLSKVVSEDFLADELTNDVRNSLNSL